MASTVRQYLASASAPVAFRSSSYSGQRIVLPTHVRFRGFRFLDAWFHHPEFTSIVNDLWMAAPGSLSEKMTTLKDGLLTWNQYTFRNIFVRKRRCKARISGVQRALARDPSASLVQLVRELNEILIQEETYWRQKARCRWHVEGERNTRYFHSTVMD